MPQLWIWGKICDMILERRVEKGFPFAPELVNRVRDVPYVLGADGKPDALLSDNFGGCARKHLFLAPRLKQIGYGVEIGIAQFDWRELPIPKDILSLLKQPIQYHMFLFLNREGKDFVVDATWDSEMHKLGFPLIEWDESNQSNLGVKSTHVYKQNLFVLQSRSFVSESLRAFNTVLKGRQGTPFNDAFNNWLGR